VAGISTSWCVRPDGLYFSDLKKVPVNRLGLVGMAEVLRPDFIADASVLKTRWFKTNLSNVLLLNRVQVQSFNLSSSQRLVLKGRRN